MKSDLMVEEYRITESHNCKKYTANNYNLSAQILTT